MEKKRINLSQMTAKTAVTVMMEGSEYKTYKELANKLEIKEYTFRSALYNNALRVRELQEIAKLLGYDIVLEEK